MIYNYQKTSRYFAQMAEDIQDLAIRELESLGADSIKPGYRGVHFHADHKTLYRINYQTCLVNRVLAPLFSFRCHSDQYLYQTARKIDWNDFLSSDKTFAVFATVANSHIKHSQFAALRLKDAIVDHFRDQSNTRPSVDTGSPDVWFNLHIDQNLATISLDTSGGALHKRGYRQQSMQAPMIETLAAAIIHMTGWDGKIPLIDPFCGSGTLLCEAFLYATHTPSVSLKSRFGFELLQDFNPSLWTEVKNEAAKNIRPISPGLISGSDLSPEIVKTARTNCRTLNAGDVIQITKKNIFDIDRIENAMLVCNPPYGIRMQSGEDLSAFYKDLGDFLKQRCAGSSAFIYFGEREHIKKIGLKPSWKKPLSNGGLDGRLVKYDLY
jgi:putative N6-adenine-specific DNA methylase